MGEVNEKSRGREIRRQAILDVARDVFLNDGYAAASMSAIAARVGGSKATLYNYFPSKEDLFAAVIRDHCERKQRVMFDGLRPGRGDVAQALQDLGERFVQIVLSDDSIALNRTVIAEAVRFPDLGRVLYEAGPKGAIARLAAYLEQEMQDGRLRRANAVSAAEQLTELSLAGLYRLRLLNLVPQPCAGEMRKSVKHALEIFLAAYGVDGRPG